ncbi:MAG: DUF362 domain-containing protein [Candidatus Latescibacterota bacterium]|jgi:hypothetical protein
MKRRDFLKAAGVVGSASLLKPELVFGKPLQSAAYFDLHPFVAAHPEAVFIKLTSVSSKTAAAEKVAAGHELGRELFVTSDTSGIPITHKIAIKPNLTCLGGAMSESRMGVVTDADFVEGMIEGMKEGTGLNGGQFYLREGNHLGDAYCPANEAIEWYAPMAERTGAHLLDFDSGRLMKDVAFANLQEGSEVIWREVPNGVIFKRIGYVAPINAPDAWNVNISKFKAHGMGITLCCKNWQGTDVNPWLHYCESLSQLTRGKPSAFVTDVNSTYRDNVTALHVQHRDAGVPRWDKPGTDWNSGWGMEGWSQKTIDNLSASSHGLSMVEGIYGRDGNWMDGPHNGKSQDFLTNVLIFGRNPVKVDIIGHWLAGHEPGNFGLFHSARDRGLTNVVNPREIALYGWEGGQPVRRSLDTFTRTPLKTYYLEQNYNGMAEDHWHLLDQEFAYGPPTAITGDLGTRPQSFVLGQNYPNPFNASTLIEFRLPEPGNARIEVFNAQGQRIDVLVDGWHAAGPHMVPWNAAQKASGTYFYRFLTNGFQETRKMLLVR